MKGSMSLQEDVGAWIQEHDRAELMPWAAAKITRAWRRRVARKRLLAFIALRKRIRIVFLRTWFNEWAGYALSSVRSRIACKRNVFLAWRDYNRDLNQLHRSIVKWLEIKTRQMGGLHLSWQMCKGSGPETGAIHAPSAHHASPEFHRIICVSTGTRSINNRT